MTTRTDEHSTAITQAYNAQRGQHEWWFTCTCGRRGDTRLSPRQAERDAEEHNGTAADLNWTGQK
jgi:hypothetical protein